MTNLKLIDEINKDNFQPELFSGFIVQDINFIKYFVFDNDSIDKVFNRINAFGYSLNNIFIIFAL